MASGGLATDAELLAGVSVGTFRWTRGKSSPHAAGICVDYV